MRDRMIRLLLAMWLFTGIRAQAASPEQYLANARDFRDRGEVKAAVIELKNALREDPALVEARLMLGEIQVRVGDGASAEKELKRAAKLDAPRTRWIEALGQAYLLQGKYRQVIDEIDVDPSLTPELQASLLVLRGRAFLGLQEPDNADKAFGEALRLNPGFEAAQIGRIQLAIARKQEAEASRLVDALLAESPENVTGLLIRAELDRQAGRLEEAVGVFGRLLKKDPENQRARLGRAAALIALGESDEALKELDALEGERGIPMVQYLRAVIAFQKQDMQRVVGYLETVLAAAPDHVQSLLLYGAANYAMGRLETADQYLSRAVKALPGNLQAVKLLAAVKMKLKQPGEAIAVLEPVAAGSDDAQLLALLGSAYMVDGNQAKGSELLARAVEKAPDLAALRTQLALGLLAEGETDQAISELKAAVDLGQDLLQADVLLVLTELRGKNYAEALRASEALEKRMPDSAIPFNLTGLALLAKGDYGLAAKKFRKALEIDPSFVSAKMNLARLEIAQGRDKVAEEHYREVLGQADKHLGAMLGLAALARKHGDQAAALEWLERAHTAHPEAVQPGLRLGEFYRRNGEPMKALRTASELSSRFPGNPRVLLALGLAQLSAGETSSAIRSLEALIDKQGASGQLLSLLATAQTAAGDYEKARDSYQRAMALAADKRNLKLALASMELQAKRYDRALEIARELQEQDPGLAAAYDLEGAVRLAAQHREQAIAAYARAYARQPTARRALLLSRLYRRGGELETATKVLQSWLQDHPDDVRAGISLGMTLQQRGLNEQAIKAYEQVHRVDADNVVVLNNLAWLYLDKRDPRALELAAAAYALVPERPEIVDTYGWVLLHEGKPDRALVLLQQALVSAPDNAEIAYHVAVAMDRAGRQDEARKVLRRLLKRNPGFDQQEQARALLKRLEG